MNYSGTYFELEGRPAVRLVRHFSHSVDRVWAAIINPEESRHWFPSTLVIEPRVGGVARFSDDPNTPDSTGTVLSYEPPRRIEFTWGADEVHIQLESGDDDGCTLTLTNVLEAADTAARNSTGWTVCLLELDKFLAGTPTTGPHGADAAPFEPIYQEFVRAGVPSGAPIPPTD
ncbi:SRPBCC family protein [Williamsia sp.]|uniref:SRPBCC family protein n=1 Tax=Williamsia sp. TaxID=1872085 RepID=UPI002F937049